jgi:hypothetical protein
MGSAPLSRSGTGLVLFVGSDPQRPGELPWPAVAALEAADIVLHDPAVDRRTLALAPRRCSVEPIADIDGAARARQLAADGWRVVRLISGAPEAAAAAQLGAGIRAGILASPSAETIAATLAPQPLATPLNGLAG